MSLQPFSRPALTGAVVVACLVAAVPAEAQFGATFGEFYFSVTDGARGDNYVKDIGAFDQFDFYMVVEIDFADDGRPEDNATRGIFAWEGEVVMPPGLTILGRTLYPIRALNISLADQYNVGLGGTVTAASTPFTLVRFTVGWFSPEPPSDLEVRMVAPQISSFNAGEPVWLEGQGNQGGDLHRFQRWEDVLFQINPTIATSTSSFGAVKAKF